MTEAATRNRALLAWYDRNARDLPWRRTSRPWPILVSEVMLQQTQVTRVVPAYLRFLRRYPNPPTLAQAPLGEVIETWGDLGYQRRAVQLREAAARIRDEGWPRDAAGLQELPGVGPYTAAAVACFAFGHALATPDVNLRRVLSRWVGRRLERDLGEVSATLLDASRAAAWNQAVMDLGTAHCRPRRPRCGECPVSDWCCDPSISLPASRQSGYPGSVRQARAAVLRLLARGGCREAGLGERLGLEEASVTAAVSALVAEGLVTRQGEVLALSS